MLEPTVESLAESTVAAVVKVDIDSNQQLAQQYQVRGVPTLLLFSDSEVSGAFFLPTSPKRTV